MDRQVFCVKLQREAPGLAKAPYPGPLGQKIFNEVSAEAWALWLKQQTMFINEYRLNLLEATAREFLNKEMAKFLFEGDESSKPAGFVEPSSTP